MLSQDSCYHIPFCLIAVKKVMKLFQKALGRARQTPRFSAPWPWFRGCNLGGSCGYSNFVPAPSAHGQVQQILLVCFVCGADSSLPSRLTSGKRQMSQPFRKPRVVIQDDNNSSNSDDDDDDDGDDTASLLKPLSGSKEASFPEVPGDHLKSQWTELDHRPALEPETTSRWWDNAD